MGMHVWIASVDYWLDGDDGVEVLGAFATEREAHAACRRYRPGRPRHVARYEVGDTSGLEASLIASAAASAAASADLARRRAQRDEYFGSPDYAADVERYAAEYAARTAASTAPCVTIEPER